MLKRVIFSGTPSSTEELGRVRNVYHGNDFTKAGLENVSFRGGIDLESQRLPMDSNHIVVRNAAEVLAASADTASASEQVRELSQRRAVELAAVMPEFVRHQ